VLSFVKLPLFARRRHYRQSATETNKRIGRGEGHHGHVDCRRNRAQESDQIRFAVNPRRWVVERFFAWIGRNRRLAKDFEATVASARAFLYAASVMLLVRRIAPAS
jgi:Transposase DDE domain